MQFGEEFGRRILVSSKRPRLETESLRLNLSGPALDRELERRGFNLRRLRQSSEHHSRAMDLVQSVIAKQGGSCAVELTKDLHRTYSSSSTSASSITDKYDLVVCVGGDGTLLETCQFVRTSHVPVLGVNSDPGSSVGKLLSLDSYVDFSRCWTNIQSGKFDWLMRSRLACEVVADGNAASNCILALNEVLLAEREVCRPSRHRISVQHQPQHENEASLRDLGVQRSCGLLLATGSGSTAWIHSANAIHGEDAELLLGCTPAVGKRHAQLANAKMALPSTSPLMSYFIREILGSDEASEARDDDPALHRRRRGFASRLRVAALGFDMCIFQDGLPAHCSLQLEHGTEVDFFIAEQARSLRTFDKFRF